MTQSRGEKRPSWSPTARSVRRRRRWSLALLCVATLTVAIAPTSMRAADVTAAPVPYANAEQQANQIRRLYLAYFLREPDAAGAAYWQAQLKQGTTIGAVSAYFAQSPEFSGRYGQLDNQAFLTMVYRNVLKRAPDASGLSYWLARIDGGMSRGTLMTHFSESPEFKHHTGTADPTPPPPGNGGAGGNGGSTPPAGGGSGSGGSTPPAAGGFSETFDGNRGLNRFRTGVFHRDVDVQTHGSMSGSWSADHNIHNQDCGDPHTNSHTVTKANRPGAFYVCRDHMMTTMGDVDGYSMVWFTPNQTFNGQRTVSWDVNSTYLGTRKWWEVAIIPAGSSEVTCISWLPCDAPGYARNSVIVGNRDDGVQVWANGDEVGLDWRRRCQGEQRYQLDPEGCNSKAIRRPWSVTDNGNGTLTVRFHTHSWTTPGSFPSGPFWVVFKDHNYTPDKDGRPQGYTWHWDNIVVR